MQLEIHPSIGIARIGNSPDAFYLAPDTVGGLPIACDAQGNARTKGGKPLPVDRFKDAEGRVVRQGARFRVMIAPDGKHPWREAALGKEIAHIEWTVHLANKKAAWYEFSELEGDLMLGRRNSYEKRRVPHRNPHVVGKHRQSLLIDPGPRSVAGPNARAEFTASTIPANYRHGTFPSTPKFGQHIDTLGGLRTDRRGRLIVLGGHGFAGGDRVVSDFGGADTWHDDISDGSVVCRVTLTDGSEHELRAWVIVASPKFAPELVNIVTLDDIMFDVAVRHMNAVPRLFDPRRFARTGGWNAAYEANFDRDIKPIIERPGPYQWVASVPTMSAFSAPQFNPRDSSPATAAQRATYFSYFRKPGVTEAAKGGQQDTLLSPAMIPMMPLNAGTNAVNDILQDKFLTLTETQYFLLGQWAKGRFTVGPDELHLNPLNRASVGNCVGSPMCPGIEVTWSTRNPAIYAGPWRIRHRRRDYSKVGLSPERDECEGGGCEPGDLTKRMSVPWQADFFLCAVQIVDFSYSGDGGDGGDGGDVPAPPEYYVYWWPPQSPVNVMTGLMSATEQTRAGVPSGYPVMYSRGINSFADMLAGWSYLGFVRNRNQSPEGAAYPSFEEVERNHQAFVAASVAVGTVSNWVDNTDSTFVPVWYLDPAPGEHRTGERRSTLLRQHRPRPRRGS